MTEPLTWDNDMELVRGNEYVVDTSNNPRMRYLINGACILTGRDPKTVSTTNGVSGRRGSPILLVSDSAIGTKSQLTVYIHRFVCVCVCVCVCNILLVVFYATPTYL